MNTATPDDPRAKRRLGTDVTDNLRATVVQLSLLNHQIAARTGLQDVDLDCLEIISRTGPLTPSTLARTAGLHPATVTGVLDRLERAAWIRRDRVPTDRRAVHITFIPDRAAEIIGHYQPMIGALTRICEDFDPDQLAAIAAFLTCVTQEGQRVTDALAAEKDQPV